MSAGVVEQVLFVHKEIDVYRVPPRSGASGWRSGEWRVNDRIFTGRIRVVALGAELEVRLEDPNTGELFGVAPVHPGQAHIAVEQATDSSRNFVLRLEDAASRRHAFVGISFAERATAFDFNVSISDHERQQRRAAEIAQISGSADPLAAASTLLPEAAALYRSTGDLSLKEGETIRINVKKKEHAAGADGDSFLSRLAHNPVSGSSNSGSGGIGRLMPLAPPPGQPAPAPLGTLAPPPAAAAPRPTVQPVLAQAPAAPAAAAADPFGLATLVQVPSTAAAAPAAEAPAGWATFD